ncbi:hypothetical protein BsWGS_07869 [Bradybaena similaris]
MAILGLLVSPGPCLVLWVAVNMAFLHLASSRRVYVNYTGPPLNSHQMPDELNVTIQGESGNSTHLHLTQVKHIVADVPVYTLSLDAEGRYHHHRERLDNKQIIGYYQDTSSEAAIELIITEGGANNGSNFQLKGELRIGGERFTLNPENRFKREAADPASPEDSSYTLVPQRTSRVAQHDYIEVAPEEKTQVESIEPSIPGFGPVVETAATRDRVRRQSKQNIFIDVVALVDFAVYSRFLASSKTKAATLQAIREYYAFIFNGVDLRYRAIASPTNTICVRLVRLVIAETAAASQFTEKFRVISSPRDRIDANDVLFDVSAFAAGAGRDVIFPSDHVMLFTGYDLTSKTSSGSVSEFTTGLAFTSTLCRNDGKSASIVEDLGGFQCVDTATHELGHSLSAPHDGDGNICRSSDRFIMSSGGLPVTESNKFNPWLFSSCSVDKFTAFISTTLRTTAGRTCLTQQLAVSSGVASVGERLPGQEFSPDDQCRMIYGNGSRMCRGEEFGAASEICVSMFCFDPSTTGTCYKQKATMGTTCGSGKLCLNGKCVTDSRAPTIDENCVYGDQPGPAFDGKTCAAFVGRFTGFCYQSVVRGRCCASCKNIALTLPGCQYGDNAGGCTQNACKYGTATTKQQCCGTCNNVSSSASTESKVLAVSNQITAKANPPVTQQRTTPTSVTRTGASSVCADNPNMKIGAGNCTALRYLRSLCSFKNVRDSCCLTCRTYSYGR